MRRVLTPDHDITTGSGAMSMIRNSPVLWHCGYVRIAIAAELKRNPIKKNTAPERPVQRVAQTYRSQLIHSVVPIDLDVAMARLIYRHRRCAKG